MVTLLELDQLSREEIIAKARVLGVKKPELLTRVELTDEIVRLTAPNEEAKKSLRGWLGVARDLVANVVEAGLHLPDAAAVIRGEAWVDAKGVPRKPVATVTLAEIYATQRHYDRALAMLDEVLRAEPDHEAARELRQEISKKKSARANGEPEVVSAEPEVVAAEPEAVAAEPEVVAADAPVVSADAAFFCVKEGRVQLYWELSEASIARLSSSFTDGRLIARLVSVSPALGRPVRVSRDVPLDQAAGSSVAAGFDSSAVVRLACGWQAGALFKPLAVAVQLDGAEVERGRAVRRFTPPALLLHEVEAGERRAVQAWQRALATS